MDSSEEARSHLHKISLLAQLAILINDGHVARNHIVIDQQGDLSVEIELSFHVYLLV